MMYVDNYELNSQVLYFLHREQMTLNVNIFLNVLLHNTNDYACEARQNREIINFRCVY